MKKKTSLLGLLVVLAVLGVGQATGIDVLGVLGHMLTDQTINEERQLVKRDMEGRRIDGGASLSPTAAQQVAQNGDGGQTSTSQATTPNRRQVCGTFVDIDTEAEEALEAWGQQLGLRNLEAFANVLQFINQTGDLPDCYLTKREANAWGWDRGDDLWRVAEGMSIGGDNFQNREGLLPRRYNGRYVEADLDYRGRRRDARRLVFVDDAEGQWLIWITLDHYDSFLRVSP